MYVWFLGTIWLKKKCKYKFCLNVKKLKQLKGDFSYCF